MVEEAKLHKINFINLASVLKLKLKFDLVNLSSPNHVAAGLVVSHVASEWKIFYTN